MGLILCLVMTFILFIYDEQFSSSLCFKTSFGLLLLLCSSFLKLILLVFDGDLSPVSILSPKLRELLSSLSTAILLLLVDCLLQLQLIAHVLELLSENEVHVVS